MAQATGDGLQELVADVAAVLLVHALEEVAVEEGDDPLALGVARPERPDGTPPVEQAGHGIEVGLGLELELDGLAALRAPPSGRPLPTRGTG